MPHLLVRRSNVVITILLQGVAAIDARVDSSQRSEGRTTSLVLRGCLMRSERAAFTRRTSSHWRSISDSVNHRGGRLRPPVEGNTQEFSNIKNPLSYKTLEDRF
jgi:hypothetical protein